MPNYSDKTTAELKKFHQQVIYDFCFYLMPVHTIRGIRETEPNYIEELAAIFQYQLNQVILHKDDKTHEDSEQK